MSHILVSFFQAWTLLSTHSRGRVGAYRGASDMGSAPHSQAAFAVPQAGGAQMVGVLRFPRRHMLNCDCGSPTK